MIKILITATSIEGSVELVYGEHGMGAEAYPPLLRVDFSGAKLEDRQKHFIAKTAPVRYGPAEYEGQEFQWQEQWGKAALLLKFTPVEVEPDFDKDFWNVYDKKDNRIRCEKEWNKLSKVNRVLAVSRLDAYFRYLHRIGYRSKMGADRYLKEKQWTTDWDNLTT
jgi:hypothetical protein